MILLMLAEFGAWYGYVRTVSLLPDTLNAPSVLYDFHYVKPGIVAIFGDNGCAKVRWRN